MQEIKRIGVWSTAKILLLFGVLFGLLMGIYSSLVLPQLIQADPTLAAQFGSQFTTGFSWAIFFTVLITYALLLFLSGIIGALIYNLFAKLVGGIKVDLIEAKKKK